MWVPSKILSVFSVSSDLLNGIKEENTALRAENVILRQQLNVTQTNFDWLRIKINQLEFERAALIERAYNIKLPVPELARRPLIDPIFDPRNFSGFEDVGDELARDLGLE